MFQQKRTDPALWLNGITFGMIVIASVGGALQILLPQTTLIVDTILGAVITIGNAYLRIFVTTKPLDTVRNRQKAANQSGEVLDKISNTPITTAEINQGRP